MRRFSKPEFPTNVPQASYRFGGTDIFLYFVVNAWQVWKVEGSIKIYCGTEQYRSRATEMFFSEIRKLLI
jgi:hypothetical protein